MSFSVKPTAKASATLDICSVLVEDLSDPVNVYRISAGFHVPQNTFPGIRAASVIKFHAFAGGKTDRSALGTTVVSCIPFPDRNSKWKSL
jgi:hypothetical protein